MGITVSLAKISSNGIAKLNKTNTPKSTSFKSKFTNNPPDVCKSHGKVAQTAEESWKLVC